MMALRLFGLQDGADSRLPDKHNLNGFSSKDSRTIQPSGSLPRSVLWAQISLPKVTEMLF